MDCQSIQTFSRADITYVQLMHENIYLAVILDLSSRKCIGWDLSRNMGSQLTMNALDRALKSRWTESIQGLIHHSDKGVQYASKDYVDCLRKHNIKISMSRKGNPYDICVCGKLHQDSEGRGGLP